jgi:hypothetical protein
MGVSAHMRGPLTFLAGACVLSCAAACGSSSPAAPSAMKPDNALPVQSTTAHYVFHTASGDTVQADAQERYHEWMLAQFGMTIDRRIDYYKYRDRSHMEQVTGRQTNGWADPPAFAVHIIWPWDNHEVVHVLTALFGLPTDFFNEGIAVAMQTDPQRGILEPMWSSRSIHAWAWDIYRLNQLPALTDMIETDAFRKLDDARSYPMAGSFMRFVLDDRGMERMKAFFRSGSRDDKRAAIEREFSVAFGVSLQDAETRWHAFLEDRASIP